MRDSETFGNAARSLLPLLRDRLIGMLHLLQHGGRRRLGCAAAERRFGGVRNRKLDGLRQLSAEKVGRNPQCAVDARRDPCGKDDIPVCNTLIHRNGVKKWKQMH